MLFSFKMFVMLLYMMLRLSSSFIRFARMSLQISWHWKVRWSIDCMLPHSHILVSTMLTLWRCCFVWMWLNLRRFIVVMIFLGKSRFLNQPGVLIIGAIEYRCLPCSWLVHLSCQALTALILSLDFMSLWIICMDSSFSMCVVAILSAYSFPSIPWWFGTHRKLTELNSIWFYIWMSGCFIFQKWPGRLKLICYQIRSGTFVTW